MQDYKSYYCKQAKSNIQTGSGQPIQGLNQLEPNNFDFLPFKTKLNNTGDLKIEKRKYRRKRSTQRKEPTLVATGKKVKRRRRNTKKVYKRQNKRKTNKRRKTSKSKKLAIFM